MIKHAERVADRVRSRRQKEIGWLHDVVEDTDTSIEDIEDAFGRDVAEAVDILTRRSSETYADYIGDIIKSRNKDAIAVKRADILDHLATPERIPDSLVKRYEKALARIDAA